MVIVPNQSNVYFARYGIYKGQKHIFSHRDPVTGELWGEDIPVGKNPTEYGRWVPGDSVKIIWDDGSTESINQKPDQKRNKKSKKKPHNNQEKSA